MIEMNYKHAEIELCLCLSLSAMVRDTYHAHADEDDEDDEESEAERAEEHVRRVQIRNVELQQHHFEEHLRGLQWIRAGPQIGVEQQVEERQVAQVEDGEHRREREQIFEGVRQGGREHGHAMVESQQTEEFDRAEEAAEAQQECQRIVDVDGQLQVDVCVAFGRLEQLAHAVAFVKSPDVHAQAGPRAGDDADLGV